MSEAISETPPRNGWLYDAQGRVTAVNVRNGWFDDDRTFGEMIALLHSEVSEALEEYRDHGLADVTSTLLVEGQVAKPLGVGSELADVLVRLLDTCERTGIDLEYEFERKLAYNATRGYKHGGKNL
jgi:NTP pyrophosphatase (non-canonical NTP hydrolase)